MKFNDHTVSVVVGGATGTGEAVALALAKRPGRVEVASRTSGLDAVDNPFVTGSVIDVDGGALIN